MRIAQISRFSAARMARDYLRVYETMLGGPSHRHETNPAASLEGA